MPLFQSAVLNKYLKQQDPAQVAAAYALFTAYFHHPERQQNILNAKEEQFQEGFLRELFGRVLGYTINPDPGFQLTTELKNETGSKKADGAILQDGKALAVIELKGTDTTDLASINAQAFSYKNHHTHCVYVVTSNFQKLRFYIDNAVDWLEFDLFTLSAEQFRLLWLCLQRDNLLGGVPKKVKAESVQEEEQVTKRLYKDYSAFKNALWQDLCANHAGAGGDAGPAYDKLLLYKKTQKLLDRFLFVLFGEDKGLLPPNTLRGIVDQWQKLRELDEYRPLYERCQKYFGYLNSGHKSSTQDIFAYNGGLFKPDEVLDHVRISDAVLEEHLGKLTKYDFASEVDVNILGHIFEHSLNEIEAITAELEGRALDNKKTKRKKDGVFYTPKYITKYIVENTVGRLCAEKKAELGIDDEAYARGRKGRQKKTVQELDTKLDVYRDWLLRLTICDPACGSGAFLNQALDFLIAEHRYVDELESKLLGQSIVFKDIGDHILERNIYGVDINEESVEIARLSLWLRTATKGRKLNDLSGNIKCGNSLIDDPAVAGAKAFDWKKEFPQVFDPALDGKGGFDVVVGNPPYVKEDINRAAFDGLQGTKYYQGKMDLWTYFGCIGIDILKSSGLVSFIAPNSWITNAGASIFRNKVVECGQLLDYVDFGDYNVFESASIQTMLFILRKTSPPKRYTFPYLRIVARPVPELVVEACLAGFPVHGTVAAYPVEFVSDELRDRTLSFNDATVARLIDKLERTGTYRLADAAIGNGIDVLQDFLNKRHLTKLPANNHRIGQGVLVMTSAEVDALNLTDAERLWLRPYYDTDKIGRYLSDKRNAHWILYANKEFREGIDRYPNLKRHLDYYSPILTSVDAPYGLHRPRKERFFAFPGVFTQRKTVRPCFSYVDFPAYVTRSYLILQPTDLDLKFLTAQMNSSITYFWFKNRGKLQGSQLQIDKEPLMQVPLHRTARSEEELKCFIDFVDHNLRATMDYRFVQEGLLSLLQSKYTLPTLSRALENWPSLEFKGFLAELKKAKVSLSLAEEAEWLGYFTEQKAKAQALHAQIAKTDREIDALVYQLYGLTEEEVRVVEGK